MLGIIAGNDVEVIQELAPTVSNKIESTMYIAVTNEGPFFLPSQSC